MNQQVHVPADATEGEVVPCSMQIEQALLVEIMVHPEYLSDFPELQASHFYWQAHISTFATIKDWHARGEPIHPRQINQALADTDAFQELEEMSGDYLIRLVENIDITQRKWVSGYARTLIRLAKQRAIIIQADRMIGDLMNPPPGDSIEAIQGRGLMAIQAIDAAGDTPSAFVGGAACAAIERGLTPKAGGRDMLRIGVDALDDKLKGIPPGELVIFAGRPGMGKSLLANRACRTVAESGLWVASFQLEMSAEAVAARMICDVARSHGSRVFYSHFRDGSVDHRYRQVILDANAELDQWPLVINDRASLTVDDIASDARRAAKRAQAAGSRLGLVVVDHIGLVRPTGHYRGNKVAEVTEISNGLKRLAKDLQCGVVALCQLNRAVEGRDDKRPLLSDLRESGSIEQDADAVILLYREAYYLQQRQATMAETDYRLELNRCRWKLEVNVAKCRDGEPGLVVADIDTATGSIRDEGTF